MLKCVRESLIPQIFTAQQQQQHNTAVFVANLRLGRDEEGFSICHRRLNQLKHLTICITLKLKPTKSKNRRCQSSGKHSNLRGEIFPEVCGRLKKKKGFLQHGCDQANFFLFFFCDHWLLCNFRCVGDFSATQQGCHSFVTNWFDNLVEDCDCCENLVIESGCVLWRYCCRLLLYSVTILLHAVIVLCDSLVADSRYILWQSCCTRLLPKEIERLVQILEHLCK